MKNLTNQLFRLGIYTFAFGAFTVAQAETQNEKGDAATFKDTAEVLDGKKDKWLGTYEGAGEGDLICFYWPGGEMKITCEGKSAPMDTSIMLFDESGKCVKIEDTQVDPTKEEMTVTTPKGIYYVFCGPWDKYCFRTEADYMAGGKADAYCGLDNLDTFGEGAAGPLYAGTWLGLEGVPGDTYEICWIGYEHIGVPMKPDATCGPTMAQSDKKGDDKYNDNGAGQEFKKTFRGKKAKCYVKCENESANRGATELRMLGVSRSKYKEKYVDVTGGGNLTAELKMGPFCKNYDPGQEQIIKCIFRAKGAQAKKPRAKEVLKLRCNSGEGEMMDVCRFKFYTNYR